MEERKFCSGCGKPAIYRDDGTKIPLKHCSRCKQAAYHDVNCQKAHFSEHKLICRKTCIEKGEMQQSEYDTERRNGRGMCLVATRRLSPGKELKSPAGNSHFLPVVPPVLERSCRSTHCVVCFAEVPAGQRIRLTKLESYPVVVCGSKCKEVCRPWIKDEIDRTTLLSTHVPVFLPTAIMVFRIVRALSLGHVARDDIFSLASHAIEMDHEEAVHAHAVHFTVLGLLRHSQDAGEIGFQPETISRILQCIKYNVFTLRDDSGKQSIGFGLYWTLSRVNHSCSPNALQTFRLGISGTLPSVQLTISREVEAGNEILISYIDEDQPKSARQALLQKSYNFQCNCSRCCHREC